MAHDYANARECVCFYADRVTWFFRYEIKPLFFAPDYSNMLWLNECLRRAPMYVFDDNGGHNVKSNR